MRSHRHLSRCVLSAPSGGLRARLLGVEPSVVEVETQPVHPALSASYLTCDTRKSDPATRTSEAHACVRHVPPDRGGSDVAKHTTSKYRRQDSNLRLEIKNLQLNQLSYGGMRGRQVNRTPGLHTATTGFQDQLVSKTGTFHSARLSELSPVRDPETPAA